eukprot:1752997-Alexandrium_andersonii.AAC.1
MLRGSEDGGRRAVHVVTLQTLKAPNETPPSGQPPLPLTHCGGGVSPSGARRAGPAGVPPGGAGGPKSTLATRAACWAAKATPAVPPSTAIVAARVSCGPCRRNAFQRRLVSRHVRRNPGGPWARHQAKR